MRDVAGVGFAEGVTAIGVTAGSGSAPGVTAMRDVAGVGFAAGVTAIRATAGVVSSPGTTSGGDSGSDSPLASPATRSATSGSSDLLVPAAGRSGLVVSSIEANSSSMPS